jgi:hypothetical protein
MVSFSAESHCTTSSFSCHAQGKLLIAKLGALLIISDGQMAAKPAASVHFCFHKHKSTDQHCYSSIWRIAFFISLKFFGGWKGKALHLQQSDPLNVAMDFLQRHAAPFSEGGISLTPLSNFLWTPRELPLSLIVKSEVFHICGVGKE